jgi:hypothetical protein
MDHRWEIEVREGKPEKHLCHLRLHETRWGECIGDLQILIEDMFDGRSLASGEDILGIVHHAHEDTEEIFSGTRKLIGSCTGKPG